jgi:hypothetical protein
MTLRGRSLGAVLLAAFFLLPASRCHAAEEDTQLPFGTGTHALRAILKQRFNVTPLDPEERRLIPDQTAGLLLVVLGDTRYLNELGDRAVRRFVEGGGALLVASDQKSHKALQDAFGVRVSGYFLKVPADARMAPGIPLAYRRLEDCPFVRNFDDKDHPIFRTITQIATNRPSYLAFAANPKVKSLARFPLLAYLEGQDGPTPEELKGPGYRFAAGANFGAGKVLVLSDHSIFINDMMLRTDNDNFFFAVNCIDWLTDGGKRNHALFIEDGQYVTDFNIALKEAPPLPLPPEGVLVEKINQLLASVDADYFNRAISNNVGRDRELRFIVLLLTGLLIVYGLWRFSKARHRIERQEPLLAACLARQGGTGTLVRQRNEAMLRQDNYWEPAHQLARQWFASIPGFDEAGYGGPWRMAPSITVRGGWWRGRILTGQVQRLWQLAAGELPERISAVHYRRLQEELRLVQTALADGTLQLKKGEREGLSPTRSA